MSQLYHWQLATGSVALGSLLLASISSISSMTSCAHKSQLMNIIALLIQHLISSLLYVLCHRSPSG